MPVPSIPVPSTYVSGPLLASELTGDVSDTVAWLMNPPSFQAFQTQGGNGNQAAITSGANVPVWLDTEQLDSASGHQTLSNATQYFARAPGWYLTEGAATLNYTGGLGSFSCGIGGKGNGSVFPTRFGERFPNFSGHMNGPAVSSLVQQVNTGVPGGNGDYIQLYVTQTSGSTQTLFNGSANPGRVPYLSCLWVCANSGTTAGLPSNASWPVPPSFVTSPFLNANVRDVIRFLIYPPVTQMLYNGSGTLASQSPLPSVGTAITLGQTSVDNYGAYSGSTWTAQEPGLYYAYGQFGIVQQATTFAVAAGLTVTSANYFGGATGTMWSGVPLIGAASGDDVSTMVRHHLRLNAGDTVQLAGFQQDSLGSSAVISNTSRDCPCKLLMVWRAA